MPRGVHTPENNNPFSPKASFNIIQTSPSPIPNNSHFFQSPIIPIEHTPIDQVDKFYSLFLPAPISVLSLMPIFSKCPFFA
jgi:hypothetical protein